jgi:hypothetical protein
LRRLTHRFLLFSLLITAPFSLRLTAQQRFLENGSRLAGGAIDGFFGESATRARVDLSGPWSYQISEEDRGTVGLPAALDFEGRVVFERAIDIDPRTIATRQYHLVMLGVSHDCEVSFNGEFVAHHNGGFTSFSQPIRSSIIQPGQGNILRINVGNTLDQRTTLPTRPGVWGWRNYGGIHREVFLLITPTFYLKDVAVTSELNDGYSAARITVRATVEGTPDTAGAGGNPELLSFGCELIDIPSGIPVASSPLVPLFRGPAGWTEPSAEMTVQNPRLWHPDSPARYRVRAFIVRPLKPVPVLVDEIYTTIGIRRVQLARGDILLNARRLILKAVTWNEDHQAFGSALPFEQRLKDLEDIRNLGANAVRFALHPPHPVMLELCDSLGLFALEEIPLSGLPAPLLRSESMMELATTMAREMVLRDRNHPSVLAWGLGNENESYDPGARPFAEALAGAIRGLDPRPLYCVSYRRENDEFVRVADICGISVDEGSDPKVLRPALEEWRNRLKGKPVFVARLGKEVQHGNRQGYADPLSQQAQARYYLQRLELIRSLDYDGVVVWAYNDWRGSRPSLTVHAGDLWLHSVGLVSRGREHRLAYDAVRSSFLGEKYQALPMGSYSSAAPIVFVLAGFLALLSVAYLYNASRRFRECLLRSVMNSYNFFADVRDQHLVSGLHSTILGALAALTMAIVFSSILYHFRENAFLDSLLSYVLVSDGLKATVVWLIRTPLQFIGVFTVLLFGGILVLSGVILVMRAVFRSRVFPYHAYSIVTWSTPPILLLIPVGMILYRVMESPMYIVPGLIVVLVLHCWVLLRLLKGISIVFDVSRLRVYLLGVMTFVGITAILYVYYDLTAAVPMYLSFMYDVVMAAR